MDGSEIPRGEVPNLKVSVASSAVQPANADDEFPKWVGGFTTHTEITDGRPGGLCEGDEL